MSAGLFPSIRRMVARLGLPVALAVVLWLAFALAWVIL